MTMLLRGSWSVASASSRMEMEHGQYKRSSAISEAASSRPRQSQLEAFNARCRRRRGAKMADISTSFDSTSTTGMKCTLSDREEENATCSSRNNQAPCTCSGVSLSLNEDTRRRKEDFSSSHKGVTTITFTWSTWRQPQRLLSSTWRGLLLALFWLTGSPVSAQIRLHSPQVLVNEVFNRQSKPGYIQGSTATFGAPYYGLRVMGRIMYAESKGQDYCTEDDYDLPEAKAPAADSEDSDRRQINIVLVHRGHSKCRFTTKVRIAEKHKNAHAVIIVDRESNKNRDVTKLIMSDENNFGNSIKIPSILINYNDGEKLINAIKDGGAGSSIIAELVWDIPVNNIVTMDLWMSANSREANEFLVGFKPAAEALAYNLKIVPHYHIFSLPSGQDFENMCTSQDARYCAEDPDGGGQVTGRDVALESVRQLCIWEETAVRDPEHPQSGERRRSWKYWEYVTSYLSSCPVHSDDPETRFGEKCSENLMRSKGIDPEPVRQCMQNTMDDKLKAQKNNVAWSKYAVRINGWRFAGAIEPDGITRAICSAYVTPVPECDQFIKPHSKLVAGSVVDEGVTMGTFMLLLVILVVSLALGLLVYRKFFFAKYIQRALREEVMLEVQSQLADYIPLEERTRGSPPKTAEF
ncbi:unnamed protein product [Amoebophrya sp. A25]|nr:unnamed protein product [Amoebophrya sp. A25]|eukprot:GSA25T00000757001.1